MMKSSSCRNQRVWLAVALVVYLSGISLPSSSSSGRGLVLLPVAEARTTTSPREREERRRRIEERKRQKEFKKRKQEEHEQKEQQRRQKERDQADKQRKQREQHRRASQKNNTSGSGNDGQGGEDEEFPFESVKNFAMGFITEQPKDIMEGTIKGIKSLLLGGTVGLVSFIGLPIITVWSQYAMDDGEEPHPIIAVVVGSILGGLTGSVSTLAGIGLSLYQVGTGLWNTGWAVKAQVSGMRWHPANRTWAYYSIQDEAEELNMKGKTRSGSVVDATYYELLDVDPTASRGQIKRAYYKKAKVMHPDKNLEDPEKAAEDFLMLHKVYDTLSDEQKRADYDKYGIMTGDSNDDNLVNPSVFFAVMYDFQKVEPYIGELAIASLINGFLKCQQMENSQDGLMTFLHEVFLSGDANPVPRRRQLEIAQNLISRIQKYVDGEQSKDEFRQDAKEEALAITTPASSSDDDESSADESSTTTPSTDDGFTVKILEAIGAGIKLEAGRFRSNSLPVLGWPMGLFYMLNQKKNGVAGKINSYSKTIKLLRSTYDSGFIRWDQETQNFKVMEAETPEEEPEMTAKSMGLLPDVVDTAGAYILNDISKAIQGACWRIFFDTGVDRKTRLKRAEALEILGQEFLIQARLSNKNRIQEECEDKEAHSEQVKNKIIRAYEIAQMSANGGGYHDDQEQ